MDKIISEYLETLGLRRTKLHCEPQLLVEEQKVCLSDFLANESIFHVPNNLLNKIRGFVESGAKKLTLAKKDLLSLVDKDWLYYGELKKLSENFKLVILHCKKEEFQMFSGIDCVLQGHMCEVSSDPSKEEVVWIDSSHNFSDKEHFKDLLKHELGHVWTFAFGTVDSLFKVGQTNGQQFGSCKIETRRQADVLAAFYNGNLSLLKQDYDYVLTASPGNGHAYEFTSIVDEIIELLSEDYLEMLEADSSLSPSTYLMNFLSKMSERRYSAYATLNIVNHYFGANGNGLPYCHFKDLVHIRNDIRRIFLIWEFGNEEQKKILVDELKKEFYGKQV